MICVALAGVACSTSSVITDEIVDLYAMQQLQLPAATWGRIASAGSATVSVGLLVVAVVVERTGTRMLGAVSLLVLGGVMLLLCAVRLELFILLLGLALVCRDAAYVCTNSLCQTVHAAAVSAASGSSSSGSASKDELLHRANMWYRIATGSAAIVAPVAITQATASLSASGAGGQPYALVIGTTGIGMTLAGALLWQYPPSIGTEPAAAAAATATGVRTAAARVGAGGVSKGFLAEAGECWATFTAPFVQRPGAMIHRLFAFFSIIHLHVKDDPLPREARDKRTANCTIIAQFPIDSEQGQFAELPLKTTGKSAKFRRLLLCNSE